MEDLKQCAVEHTIMQTADMCGASRAKSSTGAE